MRSKNIWPCWIIRVQIRSTSWSMMHRENMNYLRIMTYIISYPKNDWNVSANTKYTKKSGTTTTI